MPLGGLCLAGSPAALLEAHGAERFHADDATVPVLAKGKTDTRRCGIYVREDRPFGGTDPPAGEHPQGHLARYAGILQANAYDGYNQLYLAGRQPRRSGGCLLVPRTTAPVFCRMPGARPGKKETRSRRSRSSS